MLFLVRRCCLWLFVDDDFVVVWCLLFVVDLVCVVCCLSSFVVLVRCCLLSFAWRSLLVVWSVFVVVCFLLVVHCVMVVYAPRGVLCVACCAWSFSVCCV